MTTVLLPAISASSEVCTSASLVESRAEVAWEEEARAERLSSKISVTSPEVSHMAAAHVSLRVGSSERAVQ